MPENVLYHVSPHWNTAPLLNHGVDPAHSRGKMRVSWFVDESRVLWALAHCSARWSVAVDGLVVCECLVSRDTLAKSRWEGVYVSRMIIKVNKVMPYDRFVQD